MIDQKYPSKLYSYWRSSCSWRVRWALNLKNIQYSYVAVNLVEKEQYQDTHKNRNPLARVPVLEFSDGSFLSESVSIIEWLEESYPSIGPKLYPEDPFARAKTRQLVEAINSGIQPMQNLSVMRKFSPEREQQIKWAQYWIYKGLENFSKLVENSATNFCQGTEISAPDLFLVPQLYNAKRFKIDLAKDFPSLDRIYKSAMSTESCMLASPEKQPDAVK